MMVDILEFVLDYHNITSRDFEAKYADAEQIVGDSERLFAQPWRDLLAKAICCGRDASKYHGGLTIYCDGSTYTIYPWR